MAVCLKCGKESELCLCDACRYDTDIEQLFNNVMKYRPLEDTTDSNPIWDNIASQMEDPWDFRKLAYDVAEFLPSPRKEYRQIQFFAGNMVRMSRNNKPMFYEAYKKIIHMNGLTEKEIERLKGLVLEALYQDYRYPEAEKLASELVNKDITVWQTAYTLAEYFSQTRRYDKADNYIDIGIQLCGDNENAQKNFLNLEEKNNIRKNAATMGKKEYMPSTKEAKSKYAEFMKSLGIDITPHKSSKSPSPMSKEEYPAPIICKNADFDSFIAFDLETTGINPNIDAIIEIGAIKIVNNKVVETAEFTFQEFVKPFKQKIHNNITEITKITEDDVKNARNMWEVFPDFMKFAGNNILVGYNSISFDSKFLVRAGRYSHIIMKNPHFDVMNYLNSIKNKIGYTGADTKLETVSKYLGIKNPRAHRALADAVTTAKVFLKLKELNNNK